MHVAVYGTLKEGHGNHLRHLAGIRPHSARFVEIPFRMYECKTYPLIVSSPYSNPIFVEIFEVDDDTLRRLDQLEAPYDIHRETVFLAEVDLEAAIYVYNGSEPPAGFTVVESGEWKG